MNFGVYIFAALVLVSLKPEQLPPCAERCRGVVQEKLLEVFRPVRAELITLRETCSGSGRARETLRCHGWRCNSGSVATNDARRDAASGNGQGQQANQSYHLRAEQSANLGSKRETGHTRDALPLLLALGVRGNYARSRTPQDLLP